MAFPDLRFLIRPPKTTPPFVDENDPPRFPVRAPLSGDDLPRATVPLMPPDNQAQNAGYSFPVNAPMVGDGQRGFAPSSLPPMIAPVNAQPSNAFGNLPPMSIAPDNPTPPDLPPMGRGDGVGLSMPINAPTAEAELPPPPQFPINNLPPVYAPAANGSNRFAAPNVANAPADVNQRTLDLPPMVAPPEVPTAYEATNPSANLPPVTPPPQSQVLQNQINGIYGKDYSITKNPDGTVTRGKDRSTNWTWQDKLKNGLLGALSSLQSGQGLLPGAIAGATDRNADARRRDSQQLSRLLPEQRQAMQNEEFQTQTALRDAQTQNTIDKPKLAREQLRSRIDAETQKFNNRMALRNRDADIKSGEAKNFIDENGKVWKQFLKPDSNGKFRENEPVVNPTTGEQEFQPGYEMIDWQDPKTGAITKQRARDTLMPGATLATGDANRQQQVDIKNADNQMDVAKQNVQNQLTYQSQVNNVMSTIIGNDANLTQLGGNVSGINAQMGKNFEAGQSLLSQINDINAKDYSDSSKEEVEAANKSRDAAESRYNKLLDENTKLNGDLMTELGKSDAGKQKADQLQKLMPKVPSKLTFTPIQATKVSGGVRNNNSPQFTADEIRSGGKSRNWSEAQINAKIEEARQGGFLRN